MEVADERLARRHGDDLAAVLPDAVEELAEQFVAAGDHDDDQARRRELHGQLDRLKDLYVMGDLSKDQYVIRRQALEQEVERIGPPVDPDIARAEALLDDFARFWEIEEKPAERTRSSAVTRLAGASNGIRTA